MANIANPRRLSIDLSLSICFYYFNSIHIFLYTVFMSGKVSIIGGGHVGMSAAFAMLLKNTVRELVLFDRDTDKMKGEQLEFEHSLTFLGTTKIIAAESLRDLKNSDVI